MTLFNPWSQNSHLRSLERILGGTIAYIRKLKKEVKRLERVRNNNNNNNSSQGKKMMSESSSNWNSTINVTVSRKVTFFAVQLMGSRRQQDFRIFQKHNIEVFGASIVAGNDGRLRIMVTASGGDHADRDDIAEKIQERC